MEADVLCARVEELVTQGRFDDAIMELEQAAEGAPEDSRIQNDLGVLYAQIGDMDASVRHMERAVSLNPQDISARKNLADVYLSLRRSEALDAYLGILAEDPDDVEALLGAARASRDAGMLDGARSFCSEAISRNPQDAEVMGALDALRQEIEVAIKAPKVTQPDPFKQHNGPAYRTPLDLMVTPTMVRRFLVLGSCLTAGFSDIVSRMDQGWESDFVLLNNLAEPPDMTPEEVAKYDFQIVQIPLINVMQRQAYFHLPQDDPRMQEEFLEVAHAHLRQSLSTFLRLNIEHKLQTFVTGFITPQQNPMGRLLPRHDLRNLVYFIERVNMLLEAELANYENVHYVDIDEIAATFGKKYCQDDMVWSSTHGSVLTDWDSDYDRNRIQPPVPMSSHYTLRYVEFTQAVMYEIAAMYRTIKQQDTVKLVAVDLDDTLWRGVAVDGTLGDYGGWPLGFIEALHWLKRRGVLLAIVSKNSEEFIISNWERITQGHMSLDDFAIRRINFRSKAENLAEIIRLVNVQPESVIMVDDNPVERATIEERIPGVRVLGSHLYYLKRTLLWSPETQRAVITEESAKKTEMMQGQLDREALRQDLSHDEFLKTLNLKVTFSTVESTSAPSINRALELFNKTNQFNTTGRRYTLDECNRMLNAGLKLYVFHVEDRFTKYGLVGSIWVGGNCIDHMVMSCRVIGLGVENAFLAYIARKSADEGADVVTGRLEFTDKNMACRQLFSQAGFTNPDGGSIWSCPAADTPAFPEHIMCVDDTGLENGKIAA